MQKGRIMAALEEPRGERRHRTDELRKRYERTMRTARKAEVDVAIAGLEASLAALCDSDQERILLACQALRPLGQGWANTLFDILTYEEVSDACRRPPRPTASS